MRTKFWRKRNAKLDKRLNTVIETTERTRKSIQRPPSRVTIDTSYLDIAAPDGDVAYSVGAGDDDRAQYLCVDEASGPEWPENGAREGDAHDHSPVEAHSDEESAGASDAALLNCAEEAERGPDAAHPDQAASFAHAALQREIDARREAEAARDAMACRVDETMAAMAALRIAATSCEQNLRSVNESLTREAEARSVVERERDALVRRVEAAEAKLGSLSAVSMDSERRLREAHQSLECEIEARVAVEAGRDALAGQLDALASELQALRATGVSHEAAHLDLSEAVSREAASRASAEADRDDLAGKLAATEAEVQSLRALGASHEAKHQELIDAVSHEAASRAAAEADRDDLAGKLAATEAEVQSLQALGASHEAKHQELAAAASREAIARTAAEAERDDARAGMEVGAAELVRVRAQLAEREVAFRDAELAAQRQLGAQQALEVDLSDAVRKAEAAQSEIAALRQAVEMVKSQAQADDDRERDVLMRRAEDAEMRLSHANGLLESRDAALWKAAEEQEREAAGRLALEAERHGWARRAAETEAEVAALKRELDQRPAEPVSATALTHVSALLPVAEVTEDASDAAPPVRRQEINPVERLRSASRLARKEVSEEAASTSEPFAAPVSAETNLPQVLDAPLAEPERTSTGSAANRRDRRVASQMPATLWREGMGQPLFCTLKDRSSSGARIEFKHASMIEGFSAFNVGDQATLTLNSAHEKTWVGCEIVWVDGNSCGVRFSGQFRSEGPASRKSLRSSNAPAEKAPRAKGSKLGSVFSLRGS